MQKGKSTLTQNKNKLMVPHANDVNNTALKKQATSDNIFVTPDQSNEATGNQQPDLSTIQQSSTTINGKDRGWSVSEGAIQTPTHNLGVQRDPSFYKDITQHLLNKAKEMIPPEPETMQDEVDIRSIESQDLLRCTITPFTLEQELPRFDHGSPAYWYFRILRTILDKSIRATEQPSE